MRTIDMGRIKPPFEPVIAALMHHRLTVPRPAASRNGWTFSRP
jgi:hypothetical protein